MTELQDLATLIRATTPLIAIETAEENRVIEPFLHAIAQVLRPLYRWSITDGLRRLDMAADGAEGERTLDVAPDATARRRRKKIKKDCFFFRVLGGESFLLISS